MDVARKLGDAVAKLKSHPTINIRMLSSKLEAWSLVNKPREEGSKLSFCVIV